MQIVKLTAVTTDAHIALWRALLGLDLMEKVTTATHPGDPLPYLLTDARLVCTTGYEDDLWLRIMDIPTALGARSYEADLSAVLEISDSFRNDGGRFLLQIRDGHARCTPTDAVADVRMDLAALGSLYLGAHRASAFATAHRLRCSDSALMRQLESRFVDDMVPNGARPIGSRIVLLPAVPAEGPPWSRVGKFVDPGRSPLSCNFTHVVSTSVRDRGSRPLASTAAHGDHLGPAIGSDCFGDLIVTRPSTHRCD